MRSVALVITEVVALVAVPLVLGVCALGGIQQTALLTLVVATLSVVPFFASFERAKPRPRDFMPIVVLAAIAAAGRILFGPLPNVMPVTALVIIAGACFDREAGFLTGALSALASNMFFGQGPWTPWQMYGWGLVGFVAGALFFHRAKEVPLWTVLGFGFMSSLVYGLVLDSWTVVGFISPLTWKGALATYSAGAPFNIAHAASTVLFLALLYRPWVRKIERVKTKYGILSLKDRIEHE